MKKLLAGLLLFCAALTAHATTYTVNSGQSTATIQGIISGTSAGDLVNFTAGTYNITAGITLTCGVTYTGPIAFPATAILHGAFTRETATIFSLFPGGGFANPCTQATTVEYFNFDNAAGLYVKTSFTNLTVIHNQWSNTPCCNSQLYDTMLNIDGSVASTNSQQILGATTITWNVFGDGVNSCETPSTGHMEAQIGNADGSDPSAGPDMSAGNCTAIRENGSVNGPVVIENNVFNHVAEGVYWGCPKFDTTKFNCEPSTTGPQTGSGALLNNITARYNDFKGIHRIAWEMQPQQTSGIDFSDNSYHDPYFPYFGNFDLSFACCENGATAPFLNVNSNVLIQNVTAGPCPGYIGFGIEAHGKEASFSNNLVEGLNGAGSPCAKSTAGIAWGFGANPRNYANNTVSGPYFAPNYIIAECCSYTAPSNLTGNITKTTSSAITSVTPTIFPSSGAESFPLIVTLTDSGFTTGSQPLGNTSIWYTTDGSTPVVGGSGGGGSSGATYFISTSGNDSNSGTTSGSPWLSPNHSVNCGDTILAAPGTYSAPNFASGKWGNVSCAAKNNVAWLKCATFDACKINQTGSAQGMYVTASFWGVQGWEVTASGTFGTCFNVQTAVNHIVFANDIANGCVNGGFSMIGSDYDVMIGNIAYNAATGSAACVSGFNIFEPVQSDTVAGTHMYVAGNFAWSNVNPSSCAGTAATDGEGMIFDTFNHQPYTQQSAAENNIFIGNGGRGIEVNQNTAATFFLRNNTLYGNNSQSGQAFPSGLGELTIDAGGVTATGNIAMTSTGSVGGHAIYAASVQGGTNSVSGNWFYSAAGNNTFGSGYGTNTVGTNPAFASPSIPGAPSCGSFASVPACMATMIANFTPGAGASTYGYHIPVSTPVTNPYFPPWLCNTNLPSGLISTPCTSVGGSILYTAPFTMPSAGTVKAIGMWGTGANTLTYPSGYGFVPSVVNIATYTGSGGVKTWYVSPSGSNSNPCTAISPCADPVYAETTKANPGDTVQVAAGTYNYAGVQAVFSKAGTSGNPITIVCTAIGTCTIENTITGNNAVVLLSAAYVNLSGFIVTNTGAGNNQGINITASNINITQNAIHGIETDCTSNAGGIQVASGISNVVIDSNLIYDISMAAGTPKCTSGITNTEGINFGSAGSNNSVTNNIVYWTSGGWGISMGPLSGGTPACSNNLIGNNLVFSTARGGLLVTCHTIIVQNNILVYNGTQTTACGLMYDATTDNPTSGYNDFFSNNGGNYCVGYTPSGSTAVRSNDINSTDPASGTTFVNWQANGSGNYQETAGSPTIGTGVASSPTHDYIQAVRPNSSGSGWDMGPYSFAGISINSITITSAGGVSTLLVGSTNQLKATCMSGGIASDCTSSITHWQSSLPGNATVSTGGLVTGILSNVSDLSANIDDSLTGWTNCVIGACAGGGSPGGVNAPGSIHQTVNNASPSLDGASMLLSLTTLGSATTQTNSLWTFKTPTSCDLCTKFTSSFAVFPGAGANALEFDMFDYDVTDNVEVMLGGRCNLTLGKWEIENATSGWITTSAACSIVSGVWHSIQLGGRRVGSTEFFDYVVIDGVTSNLGQSLPVTTLPGGFTSAIGWQAQVDVGPQSGAVTVTENLEEVAFETTGPAPAFTATLGSIVSAPFPLTITSSTPTWTSAYLINASGSPTMGIGSTNQYIVICVYTDGTSDSCNTPDGQGVGVATWSTSAPAVASINATGLVTGVSLGSSSIKALLNNGNNSSPYTQFISNAATLQSITIAATGGQQSFSVGGINQILAMCNYSDGTSSPCP